MRDFLLIPVVAALVLAAAATFLQISLLSPAAFEPAAEPALSLSAPPNSAHRIAVLDGFAIYDVTYDGGRREYVIEPICATAQWGAAVEACKP